MDEVFLGAIGDISPVEAGDHWTGRMEGALEPNRAQRTPATDV